MAQTRMAFNPLSYALTAEGWRPERAPPLAQILSEIKAAGYDGVHAEIPGGSTPTAYLELLDAHGLVPAPGYFQADFADRSKMTATLERARRTSADHAVLGLDRIFISEAGGVMPERKATPAQGVAADEEALARSAEALTRVAEAMVGEGVVPCLHSHVGTRIETQAEIEYVLDRVPDSTLLLGPDTGHLAWAGTDPGEFIGRHAGRIGAIHIKDMRKSVAEVGRAAGLSYDETTARHLWTEPGRGDVDLDRVLAVIPRFEGWFVVEVDISDQPTVAQSARVAADWLRPRLEMRAI